MRKASSLPVLFTLSVAFILCCSVLNFAQNREKFVISAKAGGINAITGQADVHAKGESDWQQLSITDDLDAGDRVRTANDGRIEILLNGKDGPVGLMPAFATVLTDEQAAAVLTYIRRAWGNQASPVDTDFVTRVRGDAAGRTRPWTDADLAAVPEGQ